MPRLPGGEVTLLGLTQLIGWGTTFYIPAVLAHVMAADVGWSLPQVFGAVAAFAIASNSMQAQTRLAIGNNPFAESGRTCDRGTEHKNR